MVFFERSGRELNPRRADFQPVKGDAGALQSITCSACRDEDFVPISVLRGAPPKVIWLNVGNARNAAIESLLRARASDIERFATHEEHSFLAIGGAP